MHVLCVARLQCRFALLKREASTLHMIFYGGIVVHQKSSFSDGLPIFFRYRALPCAYASREHGASLSLKQKVVLDFYKAFKNRLLTLLVLYTPNRRFPYPSMYLYW